MNEKHYDLRFLPLFEDDLNEIVDYITYRLRNPAAAERLVDDVETAILERSVPRSSHLMRQTGALVYESTFFMKSFLVLYKPNKSSSLRIICD